MIPYPCMGFVAHLDAIYIFFVIQRWFAVCTAILYVQSLDHLQDYILCLYTRDLCLMTSTKLSFVLILHAFTQAIDRYYQVV